MTPFAKSADAAHVLHAYDFLIPGGRLVAVMAASVEFRETKAYRAVRELASRVTRNPEGSFKPSGTNVNTAIVVIEKEG